MVIVDDGSTDRSVDVAMAASGGDPRIRIVRSENGGVARSRTLGFKNTSMSRYLLFLDHDDVLEPDMLTQLVDVLDSQPEATAVHCKMRFIDAHGRYLTDHELQPRYGPDEWRVKRLSDDEPLTPFYSILVLAGMTPSCVLMRRSAFVQVGGWDEQFGQFFEDTDLFLRLSLAGGLYFYPHYLVRYRSHPEQVSRIPGLYTTQLDRLYERWRDIDRLNLSLEQTRVVTDAWRFFDRQWTWHVARRTFWRRLSERKMHTALRFIAGALRITIRSVLKRRARLP